MIMIMIMIMNDNNNDIENDYDKKIIVIILPGSTRTDRTCSVVGSAPHTFIGNKRLKMMSLLIIKKTIERKNELNKQKHWPYSLCP